MTDHKENRNWRSIVLLGTGLALVLGLAATGVYSIETGIVKQARHSAAIIPPAAVSMEAVPAVPSVGPEARRLLDEFAGAFESAATKVDHSVVPILSEQTVTAEQTMFGPLGREGAAPEDLLRRFFFDFPRGRQSDEKLQSLGSGVIATADGYILTNNHVVQDADRLTVITADEKRHEAKVVGTDPETDLAVIKIDADNLTPAEFGDSSHLRVGEWVIAVGNPLRMLHSVTAGIVSATGRSSVGIADYEDFIQTDASINPGNSGGALADLDGKVIGLNTAIASPSGGNVGVGFAIPINMARTIANQLIDHGSISRGYLGVVIQDLDDTLASALGLQQTRGALVGDVTSGGPADEAGIKRGDVIVRFDGKEMHDASQLRNAVAAIEPGARVDVDVVREGHDSSVTVRLGERPSAGEAQARRGEPESMHRRLGMSIQNLTPDLASQLGYEGEQGVLVAGIEPGSPADRAGIRHGDLIMEVNRKKVTSASELHSLVEKTKADEPIALLVRRGANTFFAAIDPEKE